MASKRAFAGFALRTSPFSSCRSFASTGPLARRTPLFSSSSSACFARRSTGLSRATFSTGRRFLSSRARLVNEATIQRAKSTTIAYGAGLLGRRAVSSNAYVPVSATARPNNGLWIALGSLGVAGIGGLVAYGLNERARENAFPEHVRERLAWTYGYVAGGLSLTALTALYLHHYGAARRIMTMNPWALAGLSLVGTIGSMFAMTALPPENKIARHTAFGLFNACIGATLSPLGYLGGPMVMQAMAATGVVVGSLSLVAASSPSETFLWMGGPLTVGLGVLVAASFGQMFFPASAMLFNLSLYGGLGVFGMFVLYDTQRILDNARRKAVYDPMTESLAIYLNTINIFIRIATILAGNQGQKRRK